MVAITFSTKMMLVHSCTVLKPGFQMSGKSQTIGGFHFLPTIPDFAHISDNGHKFVLEAPCLCVIGDWCPKN